MSEQRRTVGWVGTIAAGVIIGAVEVVLAVAFAAFVFGGLPTNLADGIGLYLVAAVLTLGILAWRAGSRGVVGSVQDAAAAVLAVIGGVVVAKIVALRQIAEVAAVGDYELPDPFLTVIAATLVVTVSVGVIFLLLGTLRVGNLVRYVPYPVVGGFLAGTGWLLLNGGIYVACGIQLRVSTIRNLSVSIGDLTGRYALLRWGPAFAFGLVLLVAVRVIRRPLVIPIVLGLGVVAFAIGMLVTGSTIETAKTGSWLLGPFEAARLWEPWTARALTGADWGAVLGQWLGIATAVFVAVMAMLFNVSGSEVVLGRDLDSNRELRDAGILNMISGAVGGIPGYHALSLTALADRMKVNARTAGLIAAAVPLAAVVFGAGVVELIPRMIVGGVLVLLGLAFLVEWAWDKRRALPRLEYAIVLLILATIIARGFLDGVVLGLVLAVFLFAIRYGRIELVREVAFGETYHSNVDRPAEERAALASMSDRVQILRLHGFVFFGTSNGLLEKIRKRVEESVPRFLVVDLRRVSGVDSSAVASIIKVTHLAAGTGFELVFTGASDAVRKQLERGGVVAANGVVAFEPDLDRGLQRAEDALLAGSEAAARVAEDGQGEPAGMPEGLRPYLERVPLDAGAVLIRQDDAPGDVYVLESGRLVVEVETTEGTRMRLRTIRPGVVVGEVAMYSGVPRTADVVAETASVVLRLGADALERMEASEPALAAQVHRWLATTVAGRLDASLKAFDALLE